MDLKPPLTIEQQICKLLDKHPVFPSDGYRNQIKAILRDDYHALVKQKTISFSEGRG